MFNKKRVITATISLIAGFFIATSANATVDGVYLGGQIGWGSINDSGFNDAYDNQSTNSGVAGRVFGGYQFNQYTGLELGFTKFSNMNTSGIYTFSGYNFSTSGTIKTYATDVVAKLNLPLSNGFNIFGKLGVAYLNEQWSISSSNASIGSVNASGTEDGFLPTFGLGLGYDVNQNISADVSWMRIQQVGSVNLDSTDTVMVGLSYHFG
jgi:OmpA-OmpF porin, OOP family